MCMFWHNLAQRISDTSRYGVSSLQGVFACHLGGSCVHTKMDAIFDHLTMYGLGLKVVTVERNHLLAWGYSLRYTSAFVKAGALAVNIMSYLLCERS